MFEPDLTDNDRHLLDVVTRLRLEPGDVVVLRARQGGVPGVFRAIRDEIHRLAPHWKGVVIIMGEHEDLYRLDDEQQRQLYEHLRKRFEERRG